MYGGIFPEITAFSVDVVRGGKQSNTKDQGGIADGRNPDQVHPGGYSRRDASSCGGFEQPKGGDECRFPLIFFPKLNVVIPPSDVELGEERRVLHIIN